MNGLLLQKCRSIPWSSSSYDPALSLPRDRVRFLIRELRSCKLQCSQKKKKEDNKNAEANHALLEKKGTYFDCCHLHGGNWGQRQEKEWTAPHELLWRSSRSGPQGHQPPRHYTVHHDCLFLVHAVCLSKWKMQRQHGNVTESCNGGESWFLGLNWQQKRVHKIFSSFSPI